MLPRCSHVTVPLAAVCLLLAAAANVRAHCDTLSGPVVAAAKAALEQNDVTPLLKWVKPTEEAELRNAFRRTATVRRLSAEARELADRFFFETTVRLHRLGEGEPYTGIRDADPEPALEMADKALATGAIDGVIKLLTEHAAAGIRDRFTVASAARKHADENVAAGRQYVAAYVEFIHYVEQVHAAVAGEAHEADRTRPMPPREK